jgi:pilus assembly protein FimV
MSKLTLKSVLCLVCWCYTITAQSLTLSEIELKSFLNQALDARIVLGGVNSGQLEGLSINIISGEAAPGQRTVTLQHELMNDGSGHYIQLSTREAVREPVLSFTLEISWSEGRLLREYTLLMDPKN